MIFQINFEADVDLSCRGGLRKQYNIIHSWQSSIGVGVQSVVNPNVKSVKNIAPQFWLVQF